jgi:pimeloyl-ACP methyl ester carboxylesterase
MAAIDRSPKTVLFFGGNGHCAWRLRSARRALARREARLDLREAPYPGFEGRPRAGSRGAFLSELADWCRASAPAAAAMATGIGALVALSLRADNALPLPLIFQGPVLWGLEQRIFPRLMRWPRARKLLRSLFMRSWLHARLARRGFGRPLGGADREHFFEGYAHCAAFEDLFAWFTPDWLRVLEDRLRSRPERLEGITVWVGGRDAVVGRAEVRATERALGVRWPVVEFPDWGHYPMIDVPEEWADALCQAVATA